jgi:anti-sigma factor RsiW
MEPCLDDVLKLDHLNGTLAGEDRTLFEEHLAACPACRREIDELRKTAAAVAGLTPPAVPPAWTAAAKDRLRAKALAAAVVPPGPAPARRRTNVFQYAAIAAGVTGGLALLFGLVMGSPVRSWLPDLSAALGIPGPSAARAARLAVWILSLHALLLVPSIIDNVYGLVTRDGRKGSISSQ